MSESENSGIKSEPEDAVSCSHDMEPADDGASADVVVVALIVCVLLKRHLKKTRIGYWRWAQTLQHVEPEEQNISVWIITSQ